MANETIFPYEHEGLELITCVIQRGKADKIAKSAIEAGAGGATIFYARGMGIRERLGLLGLAIVPEKEVIMIISSKATTPKIFDAIVKAAHLEVPGMGVAYVTPITAVAGIFSAQPSKEQK